MTSWNTSSSMLKRKLRSVAQKKAYLEKKGLKIQADCAGVGF